MINLDEVGAFPKRDATGNWQVHFGIYLPGITFNKGYAVKVRVIHDEDQFVRGIEPKEFFLNWQNGSPRRNLIQFFPAPSNARWKQPGQSRALKK